jgi:hypothetical protein
MQLAFDFKRRGSPPAGSLEARMTRALRMPVDLVVTDNRRRMISTRRHPDRLEVRLHQIFLDAPDAVVEELLCFLADPDPRAAAVLRGFVEQCRERITRPPRRILLRTAGQHHDLAEIFAEVKRDHFSESVEGARITWGKMPRKRRRRTSIRLGTYTHDQKLIRIHPALDQAAVPRFFVAFVVFHELLHHVVPARRSHGRIDYHPREFKLRERSYPEYARAIAWERANVDALLRYRG